MCQQVRIRSDSIAMCTLFVKLWDSQRLIKALIVAVRSPIVEFEHLAGLLGVNVFDEGYMAGKSGRVIISSSTSPDESRISG